MTAQLQLFMILGAVVLLLIIFAFLKRGLMSVKYSLLWLALAVGLVWLIIALTGLLIARSDAKQVNPGPAFATTRDGVWIAGLWLSWPEVGSFRAAPGRLGRSPQLRVEGRDGRAATVPMAERYGVCPACGSHHLELTGGTEMRVKEIEIE